MRIIKGTLQRRKITAPKNLPVRPTTDFAKEALFNIIEDNFFIEGLEILDLFAGTGNISYEFISRGADVTAVDLNHDCVKFINKTKSEFELDNLKIIKSDALRFIKSLRKSYDIVFADPPYDFKKTEELVKLILEREILNEDGLLIVEHGKETPLKHLKSWQETRVYGRVNFSFFAPLEKIEL
ncbi:MAG: 16S rRNA (guanine(966)-N(2))-methyltransferase RsmD [Bernardetiaceae bacterium]|nr:16S rRNA (guanine(966)-N(2))-methyltransferase RsmD [Bernardetiaceae bacterium]